MPPIDLDVLRRLAVMLAELYDEHGLVRLAMAVGLDLGHAAPGRSRLALALALVAEARQTDRLDGLIARAHDEHPDAARLGEAASALSRPVEVAAVDSTPPPYFPTGHGSTPATVEPPPSSRPPGMLARALSGLATIGPWAASALRRSPSAEADAPREAGGAPWFAAYRPSWVRGGRTFAVHVHIVPAREDIDRFDAASRRAASSRGNPALATTGVALDRALRPGELVSCRVECPGFEFDEPAPRAWQGQRLRFIVQGTGRDAPTGTHRALLTISTPGASAGTGVRGEADFDLEVVLLPPRSRLLRAGGALVLCGVGAALLAATQGHAALPVYALPAGGVSLAFGTAAMLPLFSAPPLATALREAPTLRPPVRDVAAIETAIQARCAALDGPTLARARGALVDACPSYRLLAELVRYELSTSLAAEVGEGPLQRVAFDLLEWTQAQGRTARLLAGAHARAPEHAGLAAVIRELGGDA